MYPVNCRLLTASLLFRHSRWCRTALFDALLNSNKCFVTSRHHQSKKGNGELLLKKSSEDQAQNKKEIASVDVDPTVKMAAKKVAECFSGDMARNTESDLLQQLRAHAVLTESQRKSQASSKSEDKDKMSEILTAMRVQKEKIGQSRIAENGRRQPRTYAWARSMAPQTLNKSSTESNQYKLFQEPSLGIFAKESDLKTYTEISCTLWEQVLQEELECFLLLPPSNGFEEMIRLTKEGKLWTFPINNEAGMSEEATFGFHQHIFLENLIQDFPKKGPVRHFIELVITGLSKNPYLTVQQKKDHIEWFREYFRKKQDVLEEAVGPEGLIADASNTPVTNQ